MAEHKSFKSYLKSESPYLGEWDIPDGKDIVLTIKDVSSGLIVGEKGRTTQGMVIYFVEKMKPLFCNITNAKIIERIYKTRFVDQWVGKKIQLYVDENITFGRTTVRGIRVRDFVPKSDKVEYHCSVCGKEITKELHDKSVEKYGKAYCSAECLDKDKNGTDLL